MSNDDVPVGGSRGNILPSGRSSYNLDFVDMENEWESMPLEPANEEDELDSDDEEERALVLDQYDRYVEQMLDVALAGEWTQQRVEELDESVNRVTQALAPSVFLSLPRCVFPTIPSTRQEEEATWNGSGECSVCIESFRVSEECLLLPCRHLFHRTCLTPWFRGHRSCPYCRAEIIIACD